MARRAAYVESLRTAGIPILLLDAGDFFAAADRTTDILSVVAWKEMERLGYDAATLGYNEFQRWSLVEYLLSESRLPLVTTNVEVKRNDKWEPLGVPYLIVQRGGLRIGVLGLTEKSDLPSWVLRSRADSLRVLPVVDAARRACVDLDGRVDLVVALVASKANPSRSLPREVPEIDVVVAGPGVCSVGGQALTKTQSRGMSLGITHLVVSPSGKLLSHEGHNVALTRAHREDPVIARDAQRVVEESRSMREEIRQAGPPGPRRHWRPPPDK